MAKSAEQRKKEFQCDLATSSHEHLLRKHVIFGECFSLGNAVYFELKQDIASRFDLHPSQVVMVGSGKLGFSISEKTIRDRSSREIIEVKPRYRLFGDDSDLDIAILSNDLFNRYWNFLYEYKKTRPLWQDEKPFKNYLFQGWIRPDKFPSPSEGIEIKKEWFEYFSELTTSGKYGDIQITAGIYKDWNFLEDYQMKAIRQCCNTDQQS